MFLFHVWIRNKTDTMRIPIRITTRKTKRLVILGLFFLLQNASGNPGDTIESQRKSLKDDYHYSSPKHDGPRYHGDRPKFRSNYEAYENGDEDQDKQTDEKEVNPNYALYTPYKDPAEDKDSLGIGFKRPKQISENMQSYLRKKYQDKKWFKPSEEEDEWLKTDIQDKESEEKPRYGYQPDTDVQTHTKSQSVPSSDEEKRGNEPKTLKDDYRSSKWTSHGEKFPAKENSDPFDYRNKNKKTIQEKQLEYKSQTRMVYPNDERNSNSEAYNAYENTPNLNGIIKSKSYHSEGVPKSQYTDFATDIDKWHGPLNENEGGSYRSSFHEDMNKQLPVNHEEYYLKPELFKEHQFGQSPAIGGWTADEKRNSHFTDPDSGVPGGRNFEENNHDQQFLPKKYSHFIPEFNYGGHSYGWTYRPGKGLHEKYEMDMKKKEHFLKEHERKLADVQKRHMESYKKFMNKPLEVIKQGHQRHTIPKVVEADFNYNVKSEKGSSDLFSKPYQASPIKFSENFHHDPTW